MPAEANALRIVDQGINRLRSYALRAETRLCPVCRVLPLSRGGVEWVRCFLIVPTLRVGMHTVTLCVTLGATRNVRWLRDAERPGRHTQAGRGNDRRGCMHSPAGAGLLLNVAGRS
jgi:hypothetical protein